jgi:hypothetical protein
MTVVADVMIIVVYLLHFYSKTNKLHNISNLFYFGTTLYTFRMVIPTIIRSLKTAHTATGPV